MIIISGIISKIILETFNFFFFLFIHEKLLQSVTYLEIKYNQWQILLCYNIYPDTQGISMSKKFSLLLTLTLLSSSIFAQPMMKNDPKRPVGKISKDLGITSNQFVECFNTVRPTPGGHRPESGERVRSNKQILLTCLEKYNTSISNDSLDTVMDKYRPGGRAAQEPRNK